MSHDLVAMPITPENFAPFGRVMRPGQATHGLTTRAIRVGTVTLTRSAQPFGCDPDARWSLDFYETALFSAPLSLTVAERHPHTAQVFIPMSVTRWLVVVWPSFSGDQPGGQPLAVLAGPEEAISYDANVWHHGIVALAGTGIFASGMGRMPEGDDTEFANLTTSVTVRLPT